MDSFPDVINWIHHYCRSSNLNTFPERFRYKLHDCIERSRKQRADITVTEADVLAIVLEYMFCKVEGLRSSIFTNQSQYISEIKRIKSTKNTIRIGTEKALSSFIQVDPKIDIFGLVYHMEEKNEVT